MGSNYRTRSGSYVADRCWLNEKQLVQLRKDYGRGKKWQVTTEWIFAEARKEFSSEQEAINHVDSLLTMAKQSDQKSESHPIIT